MKIFYLEEYHKEWEDCGLGVCIPFNDCSVQVWEQCDRIEYKEFSKLRGMKSGQ